MPVFPRNARVTYIGSPATVVRGNEAGEWAPEPTATISIRFDKAPRGMSAQIDTYAASVLPVR